MMILRGLELVAQRTTWVLAAGVFAGIAWQPLAGIFAPWLEAFIVMNLSLSMMRIEPAALRDYLRRPVLIATIFVFSMGIAPLVLWGFTSAAGIDGPVGAGIVFHALATPIMSGSALCILFGLDAALALIVTVLSYALVPFTLPPLALWLLGIELDVTVLELMWRLGRIVGVSFLIAFAARKILGADFLKAQASRMDGIMVFGMVGVAVSLMSGLPEFAAAKPNYTAVVTATTFAINIGLQITATALFWRIGRRAALTIGLITGNTNTALVMAALGENAPYELLVYFVVGQFPIYILPLVAVPIYRWIAGPEKITS
jgi:BASS family bile acid:Na+ symporter